MFLKDTYTPRKARKPGLATIEVDKVLPGTENGELVYPQTETPERLPSPSVSVNSTSEGGPMTDSLLKSTAVSGRARGSKRKKDKMSEVAYAVMKRVEANNANRDEFDSYGETVAMTLRKLSNVSAAYAKFEISKVLFQAELGQYERGNSNIPSMLTPPINPAILHHTSTSDTR
ncbi:uncharacterized protein LOC129001863 [Macrosteles quadrilineatus]|uniref:uncharacterized protein LOC129001863 n=1 Tax=Macrosteles quadrilineatus TaxID=74068 RepID=UPI0023E0F074|nr:uncharacterized protein LOC129001863 [Macrosteles quadrilineatus]